VRTRSIHFPELRKAKGASKINISSAAFDLKFQLRTRGHPAGTSNRRHWHHTTSPSAIRIATSNDHPALNTRDDREAPLLIERGTTANETYISENGSELFSRQSDAKSY
jgi:hypothetical protein